MEISGVITGRQIFKRIRKAESILRNAGIPFKRGIKFHGDVYNNKALRGISNMNYILFTHRLNSGYRGEKVVWTSYRNIVKRFIQTEDYEYGIPSKCDNNNIVYYHGHAQNIGKKWAP